MLQSAVLKYEKKILSFLISGKYLDFSWCELVGFSNLLVLPDFPSPCPLKNCPLGWLSKFFAQAKPELLVVQMFGLSHFSHLSHLTILSPECISMRSNAAEFSHCHCHCHCHCQWHCNCHCHCHCQWHCDYTGFQSLPLFILCSTILASPLPWVEGKKRGIQEMCFDGF